MTSCLAKEDYPDLDTDVHLKCSFCERPAEYDVEATIDGGERSLWLCGICDRSKQILKNWEVICD